MTHMNRRRFIATSASGLLAVTTVAQTAGAQDAVQRLEVTEPIAMALGYDPVAENVDTQRFPKRSGAEGAKQFCSNCSLYKEVEDGWGTCSAIPNRLVAGAGWCNAWVPLR